MLTAYQATLTGNTVTWQDPPPNLHHQQVIITVLPTEQPQSTPRKLGTLAHKASVTFADDWEITDEQLIDGLF